MDRVVQKRGRGRPRATDNARISEVAFELFDRSGYAETTMTDIAAAAGISAPTLFRYFPTKASILWDSYGDSVDRFKALLDAQPADGRLLDVVFSAYQHMLTDERPSLPIIKSRIALISKESGDVAAAWDSYEQWAAIVTRFVAGRRGLAADSLEAEVLGGTIWAGLWSAIVHWSHGPDDDPTATLAKARQYLVID
ncbi:TetR/AcrR family transcriptional regulator [Diaminobutyricibacter sp. McL0618]|uniref:TetR/AcrR family transcriptional regulator n=1 Tax=Leifsonia sp. McL0618 TaxID=3415677 RepID=UPI003CF108D7